MITFIATPIGNLKDITLRALEELQNADVIFCEDTRHTLKLLSHYDIKKPLFNYDDHHGVVGLEKILEAHHAGKKVAIVSDAGMPLVSDPGSVLIAELIEQGIEYDVLPGPSAFVNAWVLSGMKYSAFTFIGFLPRKKAERIHALEDLKNHKEVLIFYEAPHRLLKTLEDMKSVFGNRRIVLARELTKLYQEIIRVDINRLIERVKQKDFKGEMVLVVEGALEIEKGDFHKELNELLNLGIKKSDIAKILSSRFGLSKNDIYQNLL